MPYIDASTGTDEAQSSFASIPDLIAQKTLSPHAGLFSASLASLKDQSTASLIARVPVTEEPVMLWAIHQELDGRNVPPCLRSDLPSRHDTAQRAYIAWTADVLWLCCRHRGHAPNFDRFAGLFRYKPGTQQWHNTAVWVYSHGRGTSRGHYFALGLALDDKLRQPLMTMPTNQMRANRDRLRELPTFRDDIAAHAHAHPDRSGQIGPEEVADRRVSILRAYLLASRNVTLAVQYLEVLTGRTMKRQAFSRQLEHIAAAVPRLRLLNS